MDFTQIMQRYIRLREKFEQGELDADSFERQVNSMVYKDEDGRYWQIGVQSGLWYYFDGEKWVQDDLDEEIETVDEVSQGTPVESSQQEQELAAIDEIFPKNADADFSQDNEQSPFDQAFEEQLASQFAESSDSQTFKLFESDDIFDVILKGKGLEIEEDPLAAPAEEVEGLAEYLDITQPVSLESMMGEGTAQPIELDESDDDFLFEDSDEAEEPSLADGSQVDFSAMFAGAFPDDEEQAWEDEDEVLETDVRDVSPKDVVTGELHMPAEPVSEEAIQSLWGDVDESDFELEGDDEDVEDDDVPLPELFAGAESREESTPLTQEEAFVSELEEETSPTSEDETEDDEFTLDDLVYESNQDYLEATQQGRPLETFNFSEEEQGSEESEGYEAPFDLPTQEDFDQLNTVPAEVSAPAGDTQHSPVKARPKKRKLPGWVLALIVFLGVFIVGVAVMVGWNYVQGIPQEPPVTREPEDLPKNSDERLLVYDNFEDQHGAWPALSDATWGFTGYDNGFYYLYSIVPEVPTIVSMDVVYQDIEIEVEMTQLDQNIETLSTYGVMCRVQPNGDGYAFRITNNGQYVIEKYVGGIFYPINGWQYSRVIKANREVNKNTIEAYCEGNQLRLSINGHVLDLAIDDTFTEGKIGFVSQAGNSQFAAEVHYDDLYLRKP
jgi:hypothetical protein